MLGSAESEKVRLISREIIFAEYQPIWPRSSTTQTDRRTDNLPCNTAISYTSRGKNRSEANLGEWEPWGCSGSGIGLVLPD